MTKIYVVKCGERGSTEISISEVFTNLKKAKAYEKFMNQTMKDSVYWIRSYTICQMDYSQIKKLPY